MFQLNLLKNNSKFILSRLTTEYAGPIRNEEMAEVSDAKTGLENVHLLNHVFYNRYGFTSSNPFDMSLESSLLMEVLDKRKGSPLALSLVYFIIAQIAGLPIYPLCFTGGFVPVYVENDRVLFNINVFHKGEIFIENDISKLVKNQASALGVNVDIGEAKVRKDASILVMYLEFLQMLYSNAGNSTVQMDIEDAIEALGGTRFLTVEEDEDGDIFIGTDGDGLYVFDKDGYEENSKIKKNI